MFRLSKGWERTFYLLTYVFQGSSSLVPRAYAHVHRAHHAYSDAVRFGNVFQNNHHRHGLSPNFLQRDPSYLFLRTLALYGTASGQLAAEEAQESRQVPSPVAEPTVGL